MTSLIAWVGTDARKNASLYLASDSRLSDGYGKWDYGRKLFASKKHPEILGYCGDALFPTQVLGQIIDSIDSGILFKDDTPTVKTEKIFERLNCSLKSYPYRRSIKFEILYGTRQFSEMKSEFYLTKLSYDTRILNSNILNIPSQESALIDSLGSGKDSIDRHIRRWEKSDAESTSRMFFSAFCDSLCSGEDPLSGGAPQLIGVYRVKAAKSFGVIHNGRRYLNGQELPNEINTDTVKWHNHLLEICDGGSLKRSPNAQPQPRPKNIR